MKTFLLTIFISLAFFSCTPETNTVISNVCEITEEICYYANLICENYNPEIESSVIDEKKISELKTYAEELKYIYTSNQLPQKANVGLSQQMTNDKLIEIREQLKRIAEQQQLLRH